MEQFTKNFLTAAKGIALLLPTVVCGFLLWIVKLKFDDTLTTAQILEIKMDSLIGIIGVVMSVWIGLNIYNVIERKEVESMKQTINDLEVKLKIIENKLPEIERKAEEPKIARFGP